MEKSFNEVVNNLRKRGVFVYELDCSHIPYHTKYMKEAEKEIVDELAQFLKPKLRSNKWLSTATLDDSVLEGPLKYSSPEYYAFNLTSPVYFYDRIKQIPEEAVVIEISPHGLFSRTIKKTVRNGEYISLMKKDSNDTNLEMFLNSIGKLYELGLNPNIENLYPKVEWPVVRGTQSIGSLIKWNHSHSYFVKRYPEFYCRGNDSDMIWDIESSNDFDDISRDYCFDGKALYPFSGYLMYAWRHMASHYDKFWNEMPVIFEDIHFNGPVFLSEKCSTKIRTRYFKDTGINIHF